MKFPHGPIVAVMSDRHRKKFQLFLWGEKPSKKIRGMTARYYHLRGQPRGGFETAPRALDAGRILLSAPELLVADYLRAADENYVGWALGEDRFVASIETPMFSADRLEPKATDPRQQPTKMPLSIGIARRMTRRAVAQLMNPVRSGSMLNAANERNRQVYDYKKIVRLDRVVPVKCATRDHEIVFKAGAIVLPGHSDEQVDATMAAVSFGGKVSRRCLTTYLRLRELHSKKAIDTAILRAKLLRMTPEGSLRSVFEWGDKLREEREKVRTYGRPDPMKRTRSQRGAAYQMGIQAAIVNWMASEKKLKATPAHFLTDISGLILQQGGFAKWYREVFVKGRAILNDYAVVSIVKKRADGALIVYLATDANTIRKAKIEGRAVTWVN